MSTAFERAFAHVIGIEGNYSNDPDDSGGPTKYGITEAVARDFGYEGDMRDLPLSVAHDIYRRRYWNELNLDSVAWISEAVAQEMFDTAVNCGTAVAGRCLQRALNVFNQRAKVYADVKVDGEIGQVTIDALSKYRTYRGKQGELVLMRALNCLQGERYIALAEAREKDERFVFGWLLNRVVIA